MPRGRLVDGFGREPLLWERFRIHRKLLVRDESRPEDRKKTTGEMKKSLDSFDLSLRHRDPNLCTKQA